MRIELIEKEIKNKSSKTGGAVGPVSDNGKV
jgi:hypothetical protein